MIQIGLEAFSAASPARDPQHRTSREGPLPDGERANALRGDGGQSGQDAAALERSTDQVLQLLFVSPPPLPFPRVFPGL